MAGLAPFIQPFFISENGLGNLDIQKNGFRGYLN